MDWFDCTPATLSPSHVQLVHIPFDSYVARITTAMTNVASNQSQAGGHSMLLFLVSLRSTTSAFAVLIKLVTVLVIMTCTLECLYYCLSADASCFKHHLIN